MNARLLRYTVCMAVLPLGGSLLILALNHNETAINIILLTVALIQIPMVFLCRKAIRPFISPDIELLGKMGVEYVPAAYQPGKYKIDAQISSVAMWIGAAAPLLTAVAVKHPKEVTVAVLNDAVYTAPNLNLLLAALLVTLVSTVALPYWFHTSRAAAMYSSGSEKKRYLLRGFADRLEQEGSVNEFLRLYRDCPIPSAAAETVKQ